MKNAIVYFVGSLLLFAYGMGIGFFIHTRLSNPAVLEKIATNTDLYWTIERVVWPLVACLAISSMMWHFIAIVASWFTDKALFKSNIHAFYIIGGLPVLALPNYSFIPFGLLSGLPCTALLLMCLLTLRQLNTSHTPKAYGRQPLT